MKAGSLVAGAVAALGLFAALALVAGAGTPARGQVFTIALLPQSAVNPVGTDHTVSAAVSLDGTPTGGSYTFEITAGPNAGKTGEGPSFTYTGDGGPGTDTIQACFLFEFCGTATKTWVKASPTATPTPAPSPTATPAEAAPNTLPPTGGPPADGSSFPVGSVTAVTLAGLLLLAAAALARPAGGPRG